MHTENNFPNSGDETSWTKGPPTYAPKKCAEKRAEKCAKNCAEKCAENSRRKKLESPCGFKAKKIGRSFWRIFWSGFSPNRLVCLADPVEPLSASSKMTRTTNLRMPQGKPWAGHFAWNKWTSQSLQRVLPQCAWQCSPLIEV